MLINRLKLFIYKLAIFLLCLPMSTTCGAQAAPHTDYFATVTHPQGKSTPPPTTSSPQPTTTGKHFSGGPFSMMSERTPVVIWFEKFDELRLKFNSSPYEKVVLVRPFNQQAERVQEWSNTAGHIASNYLTLAKSLRNLAVPANAPGIAEYRNLTADWYQDTAGIYRDLIRPRKPARTIEELNNLLSEIKTRSDNLAQTSSDLRAMDHNLRKTYRVHLAIQDDALQQYVKGK